MAAIEQTINVAKYFQNTNARVLCRETICKYHGGYLVR